MTPNNRKPVIAGNWKMYKTISETEAFFAEIAPLVKGVQHCEMIIAPHFTALQWAAVRAPGDFHDGLGEPLAKQKKHSGKQSKTT